MTISTLSMPGPVAIGKTLAVVAITAGTIAAVVELVPVLGIQGAMLGVSPARVFQSIASGMLGKAAYGPGVSAVLTGVACHWLISILAALVFAWTATRWSDLTRHPVLSGLGYGVIVFAVITAVVVPLSAAAFKPNDNSILMAVSMLVHMAFFGLPIALVTQRLFRRCGLMAGPIPAYDHRANSQTRSARREKMRVMVFVKATEESEKGLRHTPKEKAAMAAMGRFNDELRDAGILVMAEGLTPSSEGMRVAFDGPDRMVIDGPFLQASELVAGFWLWEVEDMDEAIAWVKRCPNPMTGPSEIEIRPIG